jgi:hypothetical protein
MMFVGRRVHRDPFEFDLSGFSMLVSRRVPANKRPAGGSRDRAEQRQASLAVQTNS